MVIDTDFFFLDGSHIIFSEKKNIGSILHSYQAEEL